MRLSDAIEEFIKELWVQDEPEVELKRNELAEYFRCAPSQINYVLSTRFTLTMAMPLRAGGEAAGLSASSASRAEAMSPSITCCMSGWGGDQRKGSANFVFAAG